MLRIALAAGVGVDVSQNVAARLLQVTISHGKEDRCNLLIRAVVDRVSPQPPPLPGRVPGSFSFCFLYSRL